MKRAKNQILERELMSAESYRLYDYLCANNVGEQQAIKEANLVDIMGFNRRTIRGCISELNKYPGNLKVVCSGNSGIWIAASEHEAKIAANIDLKKALAHFEKFNSIMRKIGLDGQYKITFTSHEKNVQEAFAHKEGSYTIKEETTLYEAENGQMQLPI